MISLHDIGVRVENGRECLRGASLTITQGSLTAIMGLNGAGKTTLLKVISGALKPTSGTVTISGQALNALSSKKRAQTVAFVPQDFPTDFPFTVSEFVAMGRFARRTGFFETPTDQNAVNDSLAKLNLSSFAFRRINSLSGGERQRVLMARALLQDAPVLLLDEPLNHLDVKNRLFILDLIAAERRSGRTIVAVMHDFQEVARHFDGAVLLKNGQVAFQGTVSQAFAPALLTDVFEVDLAARGLIPSVHE